MSNTVIIELINHYGYFGIAFLIAIENVFPPIPSEVVLIFTGYITTRSQLNVLPAILFATLGAYIGAVILYGVGRLLEIEQLEKYLNGRIGKILRIKPSAIEKAANYFTIHGKMAIFVGRFVPVIRSLISIPAGMVQYSFAKFSILTIVGTAIWNIVLIITGVYAGKSWNKIVQIINQGSTIIMIILAIGIAIGSYIWYLKKHH